MKWSIKGKLSDREAECRWLVASDYYTLTREEVGLNNSDNGGQRKADSASQTFLS